MQKLLSVLVGSLAMLSLATGCYDDCIRKFSTEIEKSGRQGNSTELTNNFCRAMTNQINCLNTVSCPPRQRALIQSMLTLYIQPDYQRTCVNPPSNNLGRNNTSFPTGMGGGMMMPQALMPLPTMATMGGPPLMLPTTQTKLVCSQKVKACQINFNKTFTSSVASYNVSEICQSIKEFTSCLMELVSSECGYVVSLPMNMVYNIQQRHKGICSSDAQESTVGMLECMNKTMKCYTAFNKTVGPAMAQSSLMDMCSSIDNYISCSHAVRATPVCEQTALNSLSSIAHMKQRHSLYCGDDNGQTAHQCMQRFQECFVPFKETFFPALHRSNLSDVCRSLTTYTLCVGRLTPTCGQQLREMLQSVQTFRTQFAEKCHPKILQISQCKPLGQCYNSSLQGFRAASVSKTGLCGNLRDYFPCVARSLEQCQLVQSTTSISFDNLGSLMHSYCGKLSSNSRLLQCPSFVTCTTATLLSFSPNLSNMFEGSTWCTFMQMSIGCAEHALQSRSCSLANDVDLQRDINELDNLRVQTCEAPVSISDSGKTNENLVDPVNEKTSSEKDKDDNGAPSLTWTTSHVTVLSTLISCLFFCPVVNYLP